MAIAEHREQKLTVLPRPFVKWVGGKSQLLPELVSRMPKQFCRYFEPFVGGGALFFHLRPQNAMLVDRNAEIISAYRVIRDDVNSLIEDLKDHVYDEKYYYRIREKDRLPEYDQWTDVQRASRFIYLNKTCYNGLYRVNSKEQFNVPFGSYTSPRLLDEQNLWRCSETLQSTLLRVGDFRSIRDDIAPNDFVYFDPPYAPLSATSNFTSYTKGGFDAEMQVALRDFCCELDSRGIRFMLSNSSACLILDLYSRFTTHFVYAKRTINSNGAKRGKISEVIITNY